MRKSSSAVLSRAYVDTRLHFMLDLKFSEPFFKRGDFPQSVFNGSQEIPVTDPWPNNNVAPFDRRRLTLTQNTDICLTECMCI